MQSLKIEFSAGGASKADALVLGWFQEEAAEKGKPGLPQFIGKSSKEIEALADRLKQSRHFFAKKNETSVLRYFEIGSFKNVVLLGLGNPKKWSPEMARQAGAAVGLVQRRERLSSLAVQADSLFAKTPENELSYYVQAFIEGHGLSGYEFRDLKKTDPDLFVPKQLDFVGMKSLEPVAKKAQVLVKAVTFARSLGDRPGNVLTPTEMGRLAAEMAKEVGLTCKVMGRKEIEKEKMGLFLGVANGSSQEPKFILLEHKGGKKTDKPVALVGKGITFDSGGISLKPAARMEDMKYDMMGAAAVLGTFRAIAELDLPLNVIGVIAATENMPGGRAQKPGDVQKSMSGKTVEIINTDAEGRLILADALEYVQKYYQPQAILDFATLTGAVVDALGTVTSGLMGNHPALIQRVKDASAHTGERVWELPLYEEYEEDLKSSVADIKNSGVREAGSQKGGTFLKFFVDPKQPWAHLDIAGSAYHRKDLNYHPQKYGAGIMVRLTTSVLESWSPLK